MQLIAHLNFKGACAEAFRFYEKALGGKIIGMWTYGETPAADHMPAEARDWIIHARLQVGDAVLMGADGPPDSYQEPHSISVTVQTEDPAEAERVFHALAEGGNVQMPIGETFFAHRFAMFRDRFGVPWMIVCEKAG